MAQFSKLSPKLETLLSKIPPSGGSGNFYVPVYYPCAVKLVSGETISCVYFCEAKSWFSVWGVWPENDEGKKSIKLSQVDTVFESSSRLPRLFTDQLYTAGESGMGYTIFTIVFSDNSEAAFVAGGAVDFIDFPSGQSANTVKKVIPHLGRDKNPILCPEYHWCLFSE